MDGIDKKKVKNSFSTTKNRKMLFKSGESQGKSGSFFFFSHDQEFIIKTMFKDEFDTFMKVVADYYEYLRFQPKSIIARIYGVFQVIMNDLSPIYLLVMGNTIKATNTDQIFNIFDLKGSIVNREVHNNKNLKKTSTLKDINFLKKKKEYSNKNIDLVNFNEKDIELLNNQVEQDI